jgi:hypothetical protein
MICVECYDLVSPNDVGLEIRSEGVIRNFGTYSERPVSLLYILSYSMYPLHIKILSPKIFFLIRVSAKFFLACYAREIRVGFREPKCKDNISA